jgi:hypothetical protein
MRSKGFVNSLLRETLVANELTHIYANAFLSNIARQKEAEVEWEMVVVRGQEQMWEVGENPAIIRTATTRRPDAE